MEDNPSTTDIEEKQVKKKRNRSTKKSLAVENEKRQKCLDTLLECGSLPEFATQVLKQENAEKGHMYKMSLEDMAQFWSEMTEFVKQLVAEVAEVASEGSTEVMSAVVSLLQYAAVFHSVIESEHFTQIAVLLNLTMTYKSVNDQELKNKICELSEFCCLKELRLPGEFYLDTLNYLLDLTLVEKEGVDVKSEIKRMWDMRVPLSRVNLQTKSCEPLIAKISRAMASSSYLACKEGRQFLSFSFTLDTKLIKKFHQTVKDFLPTCKRTQAVSYGEVYFCAWVNGSAEVRQLLETQCIQNLMTHMFTFPRPRQELSHTGHNVFCILSYLHNHRTTAHFSKKLTELYMPLLWRHLRSGNNVERCNAAEVFLDMYPLEKPGSGKAEESEFLEKQHGEMVDLLTDTCHVVRMIAIRGICKKLCSAWTTFPQETVQVVMRHLVALANDGSSYLVRRTLYDSLGVLLHNTESAAYLARVLPSLRDHVHDENEKVRRSFVKLLCEIKDMPNPAPIKYWRIVPLNHLAARLELEGPEVGVVLTRLLMTNIYSAELTVDKFLDRLLKFIETNPQAARRLFQYSTKVLDYKNAMRVVLTILLNLRAYVKRKVSELSNEAEQEQKQPEPEPVVPKRKRRRSKGPLQTIQENRQETGNEEDKENSNRAGNSSSASNTTHNASHVDSKETEPYDKPWVAHALIDIVSLLWGIHGSSLALDEHKEDSNTLTNMACAGIPLFLKHYKGSPVFYAVVHLCSLVQASKLTPVSTVCSACVSELRNMSEMMPDHELQVLVHALCSWNRFADIQDVVIDWLDQGFRTEGLNQSQAPEAYKGRKVRFVAKGGKPMLALRLLDTVFQHCLNSKRVMHKSYQQVYELFVYMEKIKVLVERRVISGLPLESPMLSDEFLLQCAYRYSKLIVLLHRPEPQTGAVDQSLLEPFDASHVFLQFIRWSDSVVKPMIPGRLEDEPDISVLLLKNVLRTGANLVDLTIAREDTIVKLAELVKGLLASDCGLWFVEPGMMVVRHIKEFSEAMYGREDKPQLMRTVLPSLLSEVLRCFSLGKYSKETIATCIPNLGEVKTAMFDLVSCLLKMFGAQSKLLTALLKLFTDSLVATIQHEVKQLQLLDTVDRVQELPYACSVLLSVVTRPSLVSLWLATVPSSVTKIYSQDGSLLVASVALLHTLSHCELRLPRPLLAEVLKEANACVTNYNRESVQSQKPEQSSTDELSDSVFSTVSIDVKKVAAPVVSELADFLNVSLR